MEACTHKAQRNVANWGGSRGGRDLRSGRYQNHTGGKQGALSLYHSPSESGRVRAPHARVAGGPSPSRVCTARLSAGSLGSGPSAPSHRSLDPVAEPQSGSRPFPAPVLGQVRSGWGTLPGPPEEGHRRSGCHWPSLVPGQESDVPPLSPASYLSHIIPPVPRAAPNTCTQLGDPGRVPCVPLRVRAAQSSEACV